jgi:predicted nucleotidyltransferase
MHRKVKAMNAELTLWVIPTSAFLAAFVLLARQMRTATKKGGSLESEGGLKPQLAAVARPAGMEQAPTRNLPGATPRWSARASEERPIFDPLSRENLARICSRFGVRTISIVPSIRRPHGQAEENVEFLVEFEPRANLDYAVVSELRQELFGIAGRQVDLVCRNTAREAAREGMFERARVLYAA